ncbi:3-deoxy-manno-octulosonate cytidylyltransferase, partial [candidate division TA06 bacterium]|nr:3-deoxy-manno-octulosonate cytidylyltransferase [candidate division TA06 bacterium]
GIYAYRRETLLTLSRLPQTPLEKREGLEQWRALENGIRIKGVYTPHGSIAVDTPEDLIRAEEIITNNQIQISNPT